MHCIASHASVSQSKATFSQTKCASSDCKALMQFEQIAKYLQHHAVPTIWSHSIDTICWQQTMARAALSRFTFRVVHAQLHRCVLRSAYLGSVWSTLVSLCHRSRGGQSVSRAVQGPDRAAVAGDGPSRGYWLQPCPHSSALTCLQCIHAAFSVHTEDVKQCKPC